MQVSPREFSFLLIILLMFTVLLISFLIYTLTHKLKNRTLISYICGGLLVIELLLIPSIEIITNPTSVSVHDGKVTEYYLVNKDLAENKPRTFGKTRIIVKRSKTWKHPVVIRSLMGTTIIEYNSDN